MNNETVAKNITYIRRSLCMGQNDIAKRCKINPGNFCRAMNGRTNFTEKMLMNIASFAGITYDQLTNEDFSVSQPNLRQIKGENESDSFEVTVEATERKEEQENECSQEVAELRKENELLKAQIEKQSEEILFYRRFLLDKNGQKEP